MKAFKVKLLKAPLADGLVDIKADAMRVEGKALLFFIGSSICATYAPGVWECAFDVELVKKAKAEG